MLGFPPVGILKDDETPEYEARLLYVAMTRATHELVMTCDGTTAFTDKLHKAMTVLQAM